MWSHMPYHYCWVSSSTCERHFQRIAWTQRQDSNSWASYYKDLQALVYCASDLSAASMRRKVYVFIVCVLCLQTTRVRYCLIEEMHLYYHISISRSMISSNQSLQAVKSQSSQIIDKSQSLHLLTYPPVLYPSIISYTHKSSTYQIPPISLPWLGREIEGCWHGVYDSMI